MNWLRLWQSAKLTCTLTGAIAIVSFFANCGLDARHWYMTLLGIVLVGGPTYLFYDWPRLLERWRQSSWRIA
jgi:hypothetical protein